MKKLFYLLTSVFALFLIVVTVKVSAQERPKGLEDKGPLTKVTFIHYKKDRNPAKPSTANAGKKAPSCYGYIASGAKWKTTEDYSINPNGSGDLSESFVKSAIDLAVDEWENYGGKNIFGISNIDYSVGYSEQLDYINTASFGVYNDPRVIAVTSVWGYFYGPPQTRELVEWDLFFNTGSDWTFGDAIDNSALMDLQNIAAHEIGHSAGMDDIYTSECQEETEFGYSSVGETKKRDLNAGDIAGISKLYK